MHDRFVDFGSDILNPLHEFGDVILNVPSPMMRLLFILYPVMIRSRDSADRPASPPKAMISQRADASRNIAMMTSFASGCWR